MKKASSLHEPNTLAVEVGAFTSDSLTQLPLPPKQEAKKKKWADEIKLSSEFLLHHLTEPAKDITRPVKLPNRNERISVFFSVTPADLSVESYLTRLQRYTKCSESALIYATIYLRRVEEADCRLGITALTLHRLLITSIVVAAKFVEEAWYSNAYYARVGGISTIQEMNSLEMEFLRLLDYRTYVPQDEFDEMVEFGLKGANGTLILCTQLRLARM